MQLPGLTVGIVADDLTGANDTALQFFAAGCKTQVILDKSTQSVASGAQVWAVNTESRHEDPREAVALVRKAVALLKEHYGVENVYKKMDSTLRGHIAQECLAVLDELRADCMVIAPAYPQEGRRTVGGYQLVRGLPVEQSEVGRDPLFPVRQSHLPTLLKQTSRPEIVGHIELSTVLHGAGPLLVALTEQIKAGKKLVVIDACSNVDLEQIALVIEKAQKTARVVPCGSAGLAGALTRLWAAEAEMQEEQKPVLSVIPSPILILCGSNSATSRLQITHLVDHYRFYGEGSQVEVLSVTPEQILGLSPKAPLWERAIHALDNRNTVILTLSPEEESYTQAMELAALQEIPPEEVPLRGQQLMVEAAQCLLEDRVAKLVLCGGETATHVCRAIGSKVLRMQSEVEPSIPLLQDQDERWVITKSGNFGSSLSLANIVKYLKEHELPSVNA